jgi:hypothetical protein
MKGFLRCDFLAEDSNHQLPFCATVLTLNRYWIGGLDILHFLTIIPTLFFIIYLLGKLKMSIVIMKNSDSLVVPTVYTFVWVVCVFNMLTAIATVIISSTATHSVQSNIFINISGRVGLGILAFVIEFIEVAVIVFMFFANTTLSNTKVLTRTAFISGMVSLVDNSIGVTLSLLFPNPGDSQSLASDPTLIATPIGENAVYEVISSALFIIVYGIILILPYTKLRSRVPERKSFYFYIVFLTLNNIIILVGGGLIIACKDVGLWYVLYLTHK